MIVPLKGTMFVYIGPGKPLDSDATDPANFPSSPAGAREDGRLPVGGLVDVARPLFGPVADAARPVARPLTTELRRDVPRFIQNPVPTVLARVLRPTADAVVHGAKPVTDALTDPLVDATRPVTGALGAAVHPLPGVADRVTPPLTGVLTGRSGPLSKPVPSGSAAPHQAPGHPAGTSRAKSLEQVLPHRQAAPVHSWTRNPSATWMDHSEASPVDRGTDTGYPVPVMPAPAPIPANSGSGFSSGGTATSSASHAEGGAYAPAAPSDLRADSESRVQPGTAQTGLPRLSENDPVVSPD
ncbi:MAG: hypothetical protein WCA46_23355 [Actinocatenispora sp.]